MSLRPTHLGYAYQDLLTAVRLVDVALGLASSVVVDTKVRKGDMFDDITCMWVEGGRQRIQIKHTSHDDRALTTDTFSGTGRSLRLDSVISSAWQDLQEFPNTSYRIVLRDVQPQEPELAAVLRRCDPATDPGPALRGISSTRLRFDPVLLLTSDPWRVVLKGVPDDAVRRVCEALFVEVDLPSLSVDVRSPGPAELALLRRVADELGAGRPPNRGRSPEDVALALIEAAKAGRGLDGIVTMSTLLPRLDLSVDFGAVYEGHPVDPMTAITRSGPLDDIQSALREAAAAGEAVTVVAGPGTGKSWLCEQVADQLKDADWIVARHHCWLGTADTNRDERVLTDVVFGSLLRQLETAAPAAIAGLRPRYAASPEALTAALAAISGAMPERRLALIVDGLDHVTRVIGRVEGAALGSTPDPARVLVDDLASVELPAGAAMLIASQPGEHLTSASTSVLTLPPLTPAETRNLITQLGLPAAFPADDNGPTGKRRFREAVDLIQERSRGNALYATYLCRQALGPNPLLIAGAGGSGSHPFDHLDPLDRLRTVPTSADDLDEYYQYLMNALTEGQSMVVRLLAVCDFSVSPSELVRIFPTVALIPAAIATIAPVVVQQPGLGGMRVHHESFSRFIRAHSDASAVSAVRSAAADWLTGRGFFTDFRAFRHLPQLLIALGRPTEVSDLLGPDFVAHAIAGLQPPAAIAYTLIVIARHAAATLDWPLLVRCIELRGAAYTYEVDDFPQTRVEYASVVVDLNGADRVAASLIYDGKATVDARWGLRLCAAVDKAGAAAPWDTYLEGWTPHSFRSNGYDDDDLRLAVQLGHLRVPAPQRVRNVTAQSEEADVEGEASNVSREQELADFLAQTDRPPIGGLIEVFIDGLGLKVVVAAVRLIGDHERRAEALLHLADLAANRQPGLPPANELAAEAWAASSKVGYTRVARHGVLVDQAVLSEYGGDISAALDILTPAVLQRTTGDWAATVQRWLIALTVAHAADRSVGMRVAAELGGEGFYRAWLRFAAITAGLDGDVTSGDISRPEASSRVRGGLEQLAEAADLFTGDPRTVDLFRIHHLVRQVLRDALALLVESDFDAGLQSLVTISDNTTGSLMGMAGTGPLTINDLLTMLSRTVNPSAAASVQSLMDQLRIKRQSGSYNYSEYATFELEMARICLAAGDRDKAHECWQRSARYSSAYGSHKDLTLLELLDPLPTLATISLYQAQTKLGRVRDLAYLVAEHTDGRETRHLPINWWELLADLDPEAAAVHATQLLLEDPDLDDSRAEAAHHQLLTNHNATADPIVMAVLRLAAGPRGRKLDDDITLLSRLSSLANDDPVRSGGALPILANAITSTYDDQPLQYSSGKEKGPSPTQALSDAATLLGGEGMGSYPVTPRYNESSSSLPSASKRRLTPDALLQRPERPNGPRGVLAAVRSYVRQRFDTENLSPRWSPDALLNAVGWHLVQLAEATSFDTATTLLHRIAEEFTTLDDATILADLAAGLDRHWQDEPAGNRTEQQKHLISTAYILAFTRIRGRGGWRPFAGTDRLDLWERGVAIDIETAATILAAQVLDRLEGEGHEAYGITQALISAFATRSPEPGRPRPHTALACWDAAHSIISYRIPGALPSATHNPQSQYDPDTPPSTKGNLDLALSTLALATIALPERPDRRRALVAATVLLRTRNSLAQLALAHVLSARLSSGPLTWLLTALLDSVDSQAIDDARNNGEQPRLVSELRAQLETLAHSQFLSVTVLATDILRRAGSSEPQMTSTAVSTPLPEEDPRTSIERPAPSSEDYLRAKRVVAQFAGNRITATGNPAGLLDSTIDEVLKRVKEDSFDRLIRQQVDQLTDSGSRCVPDAYFADEAAVEDALQVAAASVRSANSQMGTPGDTAQFERAIARQLASDPRLAVRAEMSRIPRPDTRPEDLAWTLEPVPWFDDRRAQGAWPPEGLVNCAAQRYLAGGFDAFATVATGPHAGWVQISLVEYQETPALTYPEAPHRSVYVSLGMEIDDQDPSLATSPNVPGDWRLWTVEWLLPEVPPQGIAEQLNTVATSLTGLMSEVQDKWLGRVGIGTPPNILTPVPGFIHAFDLAPTRELSGFSLRDQTGPAIASRHWRGHLIHDGHYRPLFPSVQGADLILRPDIFSRLIELAGEHRIYAGIDVDYYSPPELDGGA